MKKVTTSYYCDICKKEISGVEKPIKFPVIFYNDQTEGRVCKPYVSYEELELCDECAEKAIVVHGWGAQGCNYYEIRYPKLDGGANGTA